MDNPNISIWQIYFDQTSLSKIDSGFIPYSNIDKETIFFENEVIIDIFKNHKPVWGKSDYAGVLSWRFKDKTGLTLSDIKNNINDSAQRKDVYSLPPASYYSLPHFHLINGFENVIALCQLVDKHKVFQFNMVVSDKDVRFKAFCNYWICKPEIFSDYVENYLIKLCDWLQTCNDPELISQLSKLIKYRGQLYTAHVFLLEILFERYVQYKGYSYDYIVHPSLKKTNG